MYIQIRNKKNCFSQGWFGILHLQLLFCNDSIIFFFFNSNIFSIKHFSAIQVVPLPTNGSTTTSTTSKCYQITH